MVDFHHEQWERELGDFEFDDVFSNLDQRTAAKLQVPKDGTVAGADGSSNEPRGDRLRPTFSSAGTGKTDPNTDLRKIILSLENAKLLLVPPLAYIEIY